MFSTCFGSHVHTPSRYCPKPTGSTGSDLNQHTKLYCDIVWLFTIATEKANKIKHFLYYYIFYYTLAYLSDISLKGSYDNTTYGYCNMTKLMNDVFPITNLLRCFDTVLYAGSSKFRCKF